MMTAKEIRESFKAYFEERDHKIVPSAPMVIKGDPTLMFTNAGMNQFKDVILGNVPRQHPRVADSQKCLRVSGKHNDLEEVGHDTYHHTMFEMLGNWSFGDYFKKEAVGWCWDFLVNVIKLNPSCLYATVFEGSKEDGLGRDNEAAAYWEEFLPKDHVINGDKHDNFWEMGDVGPCGPCSEIHIDLRSEEEKKVIPGQELVNKSHPQVIEIWNLVFMQYNRMSDGHLEDLPAKVIDTGMGFERLCMAVQGKQSNYDTDVFQPLLHEISCLAHVKYGDDKEKDIAMRVVADHIRTIAFAITDGQLPSNAKAGYVIRRILRRAVRYGYTFLEQTHAFMYKLLPVLIESMGDAYPELIAQKSLIERVIKEEEESFLRTLATGIKLLDKVIADVKVKGEKEVPGKNVFELYDTFGFPLDLTELILKENNLRCDVVGFKAEMQKQKDRARNAAVIETGDWVNIAEGEARFIGYDFTECEAQVLRYRKVKQKKKEFFQIVLDQTPFYGEMGGQAGDTGVLVFGDEQIKVLTTKRENNLPVHITTNLPKNVTLSCTAIVNKKERLASASNHTATHLLHEALREVLGEHVEQKGSLVTPTHLRFDFSHFQKVTEEEIRAVERLVNRRIRENNPLEEEREMSMEAAKDLGAMALFGEKYGDKVRVVRFGSSIELCGGVHLQSTGQIGSFRIMSESSVAAGIRRFEAITGEAVENKMYELEDMINQMRTLFNNVPNLPQAVRKSIEENASLKKEIEAFAKDKIKQLKLNLLSKAETIDGVKVIRLEAIMMNPAWVKDIAFQIRGEVTEPFFFVAGTSFKNKPMLTVALSDQLVEQGKKAGAIVKEAAKLIQGGGGGQPHYATAGGKNADGLRNAIDSAIELAEL